MRTEAQRRAELKRASKRVVITFSINREVMPEHAAKLEASKGKKRVQSGVMKTSEQFCKIGALLYGASWQAQISRDLNLDPRRIAQWKAGVRPVPQGVWADLKVIADRRQLEINEAVQLIEKSN